jgi:hypothetical protein
VADSGSKKLSEFGCFSRQDAETQSLENNYSKMFFLFLRPLRLGAFAGDTPDSLVASNTSGRAKNAHAFARIEDVTLCPSQDFALAVIHGTRQANPI